jgi:FAD/FMN-containing dehydrogenase
MLTATTQIRRTVALAGAFAAVVASSASARVPEVMFTRPPAASHVAEPAGAAPTMADIVARREARATKAWREANPPTIIEVSSPDDGGFDLTSAGIGAAIPLTLVLIEVAGGWVLRRRRDTEIRHQTA